MEQMNNLDYGVIGNCRSAALISASGSLDWCCLPDFDSSSVFARLLDAANGGSFSLETDSTYTITQKYLDRTNILCTSFTSPKGSFEVIDFMPRYKTSDNDYFTPAEIYRYIRHKAGRPVFRVHYNPRMNYARDEVANIVRNNHIRTYSAERPTDCLYLYSSLDLNDILDSSPLTLVRHEFLLLSYNQKIIEIDTFRVYLEYQRTKVYWLNWSNRSRIFTRYMNDINRSLLILKIMSYDPSGAVLASLTTSLPEVIGGKRNWDYRFCWLRDASMSIHTLLSMGHYNAAKRFLAFIMRILKSKQESFQIMYGIRGERELTETELPELSGYENSKPVRLGNDAYKQKQNDVFGYLLNVIYQYYEFFPGTLDEIEDMWEIVRNIMHTVTARWEQPDMGIWEIRSEEKHFVFSKVMCWVAADRATRIASMLKKKRYAADWQQLAEDIRTDVLNKGWNDRLQTFTQTYCNNELDASLLLMAEYDFLKAGDERYRKTVKAIQKGLLKDGLMYRYRNRDDFGITTASFTICTFWLIKALFVTGERREAKIIFDNLLTYGNHVGLFSEGIDFQSKRLLGNFPQAYSHLALINTARLFSREKVVSRFIKP